MKWERKMTALRYLSGILTVFLGFFGILAVLKGSVAAVAAVAGFGALLLLLLRYLTFRCPRCHGWSLKKAAEELLYEEPSAEVETSAEWSSTDKAYHSHQIPIRGVRRGYEEKYCCRRCGHEQTRVRVVSGVH